MNKAFIIDGKKIAPGKAERLRLKVGRLPSGTKIYIHAHVYRSPNPGPTLLVLAGVHGDEINGVEIVRRAISSGMFENIKLGNVIAIPLLNIYGFINFSRDTPDGKDVNRSFPGNLNGSLSSRVARTLTKKVLPMVDFILDFHTGGNSRYNYPQIRYNKGQKESLDLAKAFGAPYIIASKPIEKSLRKVSKEKGIPALLFEGGESLRYDGFSIDIGVRGIKRVLQYKGMIDSASSVGKMIHFKKRIWIRAGQAGLFVWYQQSGGKVSIGEPLGVINSPNGESSITVYAKHNGYLIGHNNAPVVSMGDALFHIGYEAEEMKSISV